MRMALISYLKLRNSSFLPLHAIAVYAIAHKFDLAWLKGKALPHVIRKWIVQKARTNAELYQLPYSEALYLVCLHLYLWCRLVCFVERSPQRRGNRLAGTSA